MSRYPKKEIHSVRLLDFELYPGPWSRAGLRDSFLTDTKGVHRGYERVSIKRRIKIQLVDQPHPRTVPPGKLRKELQPLPL